MSFLLLWALGFLIKSEKASCSWRWWDSGQAILNTPLWHTDYFELKLLKKQLMQEGHSDPPLSLWKPGINLPEERYLTNIPDYIPCSRMVNSISITGNKEVEPESHKQTMLLSGKCNLLSSVLSQQKFEMTSIKALCVSQLLDRPCYSSRFSNRPCYSS